MLLFVTLIVLPVLMFYVVTFKQPLFNDRYLIMALPFYLLLVAAGVRGLEARLWPLALVLSAALIGYAWMPLRDINRSNLSQKEDWRPAYAYVVQRAQPDDLLLIHPGYLITTYDYYAELDPALAKLKAGTIPGFYVEGFDAHQMAGWVRRETPGQRIWLIQNPDRVPGTIPTTHCRSGSRAPDRRSTTRSSTASTWPSTICRLRRSIRRRCRSAFARIMRMP